MRDVPTCERESSVLLVCGGYTALSSVAALVLSEISVLLQL